MLLIVFCIALQQSALNPNSLEKIADVVEVEFDAKELGQVFSIDLGEVRPSTQHLRSIRINNETSGQVQIANVIAACSCTSVAYNSRLAADPKETLQVSLRFRAPSQLGRFIQQARLIGPLSEEIAFLEVKGSVSPMVTLSDYEFRFSSASDVMNLSISSSMEGLDVSTVEIHSKSSVVVLSRVGYDPDAEAMQYVVSAPQLFDEIRQQSEAQEYVSITAKVNGENVSEVVGLRVINKSLLRVRPAVHVVSTDGQPAIRIVVNSPPSKSKDFKLQFEGREIFPATTKHLSDAVSLVDFELPSDISRSGLIRDGKLSCALADMALETSVKILFDKPKHIA